MFLPPSTSHLRRFRGYDYSRGASLFITISTEPRRAVFGHVQGGAMHLSPLGRVALESIRLIPELNEGITLYGHIVMPDHVHFRLYLAPGMADPLKMLGYAVRGFKSHVAKAYAARSLIAQQDGAVAHATDGPQGARRDAALSPPAGSAPLGSLALPPATAPSCREMSTSRGLWQRGYHDHVLTSRAFIGAVERYIAMNPLKWEMQRNGERLLRVREPLVSARLAPGEYWRGIGDPDLLDPARPLASVRISRACGVVEISAAVKRLDAALDKGYTLVSGFISPGERALRDIVLARKDARFIVALPDIMPYGYKPDSRYIEPIREGRCLVMAHGMEGVDFGRGACLDLNARIAAMAKTGNGCATYWRPGAEPFV